MRPIGPLLRFVVPCLLLVAKVGTAAVQQTAPTYGRDAAPLFKKHCMPCHDRANQTAGLNLETYEGLMKGAKSGPVIVAGKSGESRLVLLVEGKQKPKMPPDGKGPSKQELARLKAWIDLGAKPDTGTKPEGATRRSSPGPMVAGSPEPKPRVPVRGQIAAVAFSPDGTLLAAGGYREVILLDATRGSLIARLLGPVGAVTGVAFSPDGKWLAASGGAPGQFGEICLWERLSPRPATLRPRAAHGKGGSVSRFPERPTRVLRGHQDAIYGLAFSPDGRTLAAASYDRLVSLWRQPWAAPAGRATAPRICKDHTDAVYAVAFSPDGRRLASASGDRTVKVWDAATGKRLHTLGESTAELYAVAFHPSGRELAAAGVDKSLRVWSLGASGGALKRSAFAHDGAVLRLLYAPDGRQMATAGEDGLVKLWRTASLTEARVLEKQPDWPLALAFSPDGRRLAIGRYDGTVALVDTATGRTMAVSNPGTPSGAPGRRPEPEVRRGRRAGSEGERPARDGSAAAPGKPTVVPAALRSVSPVGATRGSTVRLTLQGVNISDATHVFFDDPEITARVLRGPLPALKRSEVAVEATLGEGARVGIRRLFLQTPMGTTGSVTFAVGGWPEVAETEPNDAIDNATPLVLPATAMGNLDHPGDVDTFTFEARAGQELVFQVVASAVRSRLNSVLTLLDASGRVLAENNDHANSADSLLGYRFERAGRYAIRIHDYDNANGGDVYYRLNVGELPYVTSVFPLGVRRGAEREIALRGFNLGPSPRVTARSPQAPPRGKQSPASESVDALQPAWGETVPLGVHTPFGAPLNQPRVAVGEEPELLEVEVAGGVPPGANDTPETAQQASVPVTIDGRIAGGRGDTPDVDCFRFSARKGEQIVLEVTAQRLGSPLDSFLEVLDAQGRPIERAALRCVAETSLTLSDRDANSVGFRIQSWAELAVNDLIFAGRELLRIVRLPNGPDDDVIFHNHRGRRVALLDTAPEFHGVGSPIYKVTVHPPGTQFAPNGMPVFRLYYQNDDGGPFYGKDSRITFDPPADGEYLVRLTDAQGRAGEEFAYRLTLRHPRPDFRLAISPEHPNVPRGGSVPVEITVDRLDDFDGPIDVRVEGLPPGISATPARIPAGASSATMLLTATPEAVTREPSGEQTLRILGTAVIAGRTVTRAVAPSDGAHRVVVLPSADLTVATNVREVTIAPGSEVDVTALIERRNGFGGRVPIEVRNLPFGVRVIDVGLNGILVTEQETSRRFVLFAEPWVKPAEQPFYAVARVESDPVSLLASPPILLRVVAAR